MEVKAIRQGSQISDIFGLLKKVDGPSLSIDEMNEIATGGLGRQAVKITADTNVLVRAIVEDDPQAKRDRSG